MAPNPPSNLRATDATATQIRLVWRAADDADGVLYVVFRDAQEITRRSDTTFTDSGLTPETLHHYFVASASTSGELSVPSNIVSVRTTGGGQGTPEWDSNSTSYEIGDAVLYRGHVYHCLQRHISNVSWTPSAAVTLWKRS